MWKAWHGGYVYPTLCLTVLVYNVVCDHTETEPSSEESSCEGKGHSSRGQERKPQKLNLLSSLGSHGEYMSIATLHPYALMYVHCSPCVSFICLSQMAQSVYLTPPEMETPHY